MVASYVSHYEYRTNSDVFPYEPALRARNIPFLPPLKDETCRVLPTPPLLREVQNNEDIETIIPATTAETRHLC